MKPKANLKAENYTDQFPENAPLEIDPNAMPALRVQDLSFYYGTHKVLENLSMNIPHPQITAIIGPSGCGKSTFLKALNRIGELEGKVQIKGRVEFFGQDIYSPKVNINSLRRQIGMVFQRPNPFPLSIYDNIAYGVRIFGRKNKAELDEIVESALKSAALWNEVKDDLKKSAQGISGNSSDFVLLALWL